MNLVQVHGEGAPALEDCPSSSPAPGSLHVKGEAKDPEAAWGGDSGKASLSGIAGSSNSPMGWVSGTPCL